MKTEIITFTIETDKDGKVTSSVVGSRSGLTAIVLGSILTQTVLKIQADCAKIMMANGYYLKTEEADAFMDEILVSELGLI